MARFVGLSDDIKVKKGHNTPCSSKQQGENHALRNNDIVVSKEQKFNHILPITQEEYEKIVPHHAQTRAWIDENYHQHPEIFPIGFERGYCFHDDYTSKKLGVVVRRITLRDGTHWSIQPSFVMPYMTALTKDVEHALFLRK